MTEPTRTLRCINEGLNGAIMNQTSGFRALTWGLEVMPLNSVHSNQ